MSNDIAKMTDKQLRNEVQLLRDELAIMKRKYEDLFYNLDTDNFSSRFIKEQGDMRTSIEVTAEGIKTKVSNEEFESAKTQLAGEITSEVKARESADTQLSTRITQNANSISAVVEDVDNLDEQITDVYITANGIKSTVSSMFKTITKVSSKSNMTNKNKIYSLDGVNYHYNDVLGKWEEIEGNSIASSFVQTDDGFVLTGDVKITEIAQVGGDLYIGNIEDDGTHKKIHFNEKGWIGTASDGVGGTAGCSVSAANFNMIMTPSQICFVNPENMSRYITLEDYVASYGGGGGTAKFA